MTANQPRKRILVTGASGYVGRALARRLREAGFEVLGVSRRPPARTTRSSDAGAAAVEAIPSTAPVESCADVWIAADLAAPEGAEQLRAGLAGLVGVPTNDRGAAGIVGVPTSDRIDVVVHAASRTSGRADAAQANQAMLTPVLELALEHGARFVQIGSVSVYGEADRTTPAEPGDELRPTAGYAASKRDCEKRLEESALRDLRILRLAPVFSPDRLRNAAVRVHVPGSGGRLRMRIDPEPHHDLCSLDRLAELTLAVCSDEKAARTIQNVVDPAPYGQHALAGWFSGPLLPAPEILARPLDWLARLLGVFAPERGYALRCLYWKLFRSTRYAATVRRLP